MKLPVNTILADGGVCIVPGRCRRCVSNQTEPALRAEHDCQMPVGPYPIGDAPGMRTFAAWLRSQAKMVAGLSRSAAQTYRDLPIEAPFMSVGSMRMIATNAAVGVAVEQLHGLADRISREATEVEDAQARWRLQEQQEAEAAAAAAAAHPDGSG